jgi:hypothetical protein
MQLTTFILAISSTLAVKFTVQYSQNGDHSQRTPKDFKATENICYKLPYNWYEVSMQPGYVTQFWKDSSCRDKPDAKSNDSEFDLNDINRYLKLKTFKIVKGDEGNEGQKFWWLGGNFGDDVFGDSEY